MRGSPLLVSGDDLLQMPVAQQAPRLRGRKFCLEGGNRICNLPAGRRAKSGCCVFRLVQEASKPLGSLELFSQAVSQVFPSRFALCQADAFVAKKLIHALNVGVE